MKLRPRTRLWIEDEKGGIVFGSGRVRILAAIDETGSMNKAARRLGMSYRTVWGKIHDTEDRLGFKLIETRVGGSFESGSRLTPEGRELVKRYEKWRRATIEYADRQFNKLFARGVRRQ